MTFIELLSALVVFSLIGSAMAILIVGVDNINRYSVNQSGALWEIEAASRRIAANARCAISAAAVAPSPSGMTPTVTTDSNGQSHLTFIVPNNNTTTYTATSYQVQYFCVGSAAPFTLVELDARYSVPASPSVIAHNVTSFSASLDSTNKMKIWTDLKVKPTNGWTMERRNCSECRNY